MGDRAANRMERLAAALYTRVRADLQAFDDGFIGCKWDEADVGVRHLFMVFAETARIALSAEEEERTR